MDKPVRYGEAIIQYLKLNKLTTVQFAKLIKVSPQTVINWTKGIDCNDYRLMNQVLRKIEFVGICQEGNFHFEGKPQLKKKFQTEKGRQRYYESAKFDDLKDKVYQRSGNKCELCGCPGSGSDNRKGLTCHHLIYDNDFGTGKEDLNDLISVCYYHHSMLHAGDTPEKAKAFKEFKDGVYKVLLIPHKDGTYNIKLFHDECSDTDIKAYFKQLMRKVKYKPSFEILKIGNSNNVNKLKLKDFKYVKDSKQDLNLDRIRERSDDHCELCGGKLETIIDLRSKSDKFDKTTPLYSLIGLCMNCAKSIVSGKAIKTNQAVNLIVFVNKDGSHAVKAVPGNITTKEINAKVKGNYSIQGPFFITDIISQQKLKYYLS